MRSVDEIITEMQASFDKAMSIVEGALRLLEANNIEPLTEHQEIAYAWGTGQIDDEEFLHLARIIAAEHGRDSN